MSAKSNARKVPGKPKPLSRLVSDDRFAIANMAVGFMEPQVLSREPEACRQFLKFAVKVTNLAEDMRLQFVTTGDRASLEALAAHAPHWPARAFPGSAAKRERAEIDRLPIGKHISAQDLEPRESKPGRPPNESASLARELLCRLLEIRSGEALGSDSDPDLAVAIRQTLPVLDSACFDAWFSCGWQLLTVLASEPSEEQLEEYRKWLRDLVRSKGDNIERALRAESTAAPLYPIGSKEAKYPMNRFAKFLANGDRAMDLKEKGLKKAKAEVSAKMSKNQLRDQGLVSVITKLREAEAEVKVEASAKSKATTQRKNDFEKTCRREWLRRV